MLARGWVVGFLEFMWRKKAERQVVNVKKIKLPLSFFIMHAKDFGKDSLMLHACMQDSWKLQRNHLLRLNLSLNKILMIANTVWSFNENSCIKLNLISHSYINLLKTFNWFFEITNYFHFSKEINRYLKQVLLSKQATCWFH